MRLISLMLLAACNSPGDPNADSNTIIDDTDDTDVTDNIDDDNDGFSEADGDCDDEQPAINPTATDIVGDTIDQNCDGADGFDADGDGHADKASGGDDCNDEDHFTFPGAVEIWYDGIDQGCVGASWDGDSDQDGDGWDATVIEPSFALMGGDCDDRNPLIYPGRGDAEDGIDDNCEGRVDGTSLVIEWDPMDPLVAVHLEVADIADRRYELFWYPLVQQDSEDFGGINFYVVDGWDDENVSPARTDYEAEYTTLTYTFETGGFGDYEGFTIFAWGPRAAEVCPFTYCVYVDATTL